MTELERLALLGDKQAQKECTEKGIVLPCPKCLSKINVKETHDGVMRLECNYGLSYIFKSWEEQKKLVNYMEHSPRSSGWAVCGL